MAKALRRAPRSSVSLQNGPNRTKTDAEAAEVFAASLRKQFCPNPDLIPTFTLEVHRDVQTILQLPSSQHLEPTNPSEITEIIQTLSPNKAPGPDQLTNRVIKNLPLHTILFLTNLFNSILRLQYFPSTWKTSTIILIPKAGKPTHIPENHRPISLLSSFSKLLERIILTRLNTIITDLQLIPNDQHGFRAQHSTIHQLTRVTNHISNNLNRQCPTAAVFLDVSKAFDRVWHEGLLYKMYTSQIPIPFIKLIHSYLSNRSSTVRVNNAYSTPIHIRAGVPQGSVLGPTLYNIYTHDIPTTDETILAIYADDTAILSSSKLQTAYTKRIQKHLDLITTWSRIWRILINPNKTQAIIFKNTDRLKHSSDTCNLFLDNVRLDIHNSVKYLGVILDKKLSFTEHIRHTRTKANRIAGYLYPLHGRNSLLSLDNKLLIYKSIIRPVMTYGAPVWHNANPQLIHTLTAKQNKILRQITNSHYRVPNDTIHNDLGIETLTEHIKTLATQHHTKATTHTNPTISHCYITPLYGKRKRRPTDI